MIHANDLDESQRLQLKKLLKQVYPPDAPAAPTVLKKIDAALYADGELYDAIYESAINHVVRRLITLALFLYREYADDEYLFIPQLFSEKWKPVD